MRDLNLEVVRGWESSVKQYFFKFHLLVLVFPIFNSHREVYTQLTQLSKAKGTAKLFTHSLRGWE